MNVSLSQIRKLIVLLSALGFADAAYLTVKYYQGSPVVCGIFDGCDRVTSSVYATVGSVPVALIGSLYYFLIFAIGGFWIWNRREAYFDRAMIMTSGGLIASLWLVYLQIFVIKALCFYCMVSALISTLIFVLASIICIRNKNEKSGIIKSNSSL